MSVSRNTVNQILKDDGQKAVFPSSSIFRESAVRIP